MTFNVLVRHPERTLTADKDYNDVVEYVLVYSKSPSFKMPKIAVDKTVDDYQWVINELSSGKEIEFDGRKARIFEPNEYELKKVAPSKENFKIVTERGSIKEKVSSGRFYVKYLQPIEKEYPAKTIFKVDNIGDDMYSYRYFYLPPEGNKNGAYLQGMPTSSSKTYKPYPNFLDFVQSYNTVNNEGGVEFRNGKKPEDLVAFLMEIFTSEGDYVLDTSSRRIRLDTLKDSAIDNYGRIFQNDTQVAQIGVVDFEDYSYLEKYGENYYIANEGAQVKEADAGIESGYLEMSNVQTVSEMVNLISITRAYESNQKIMQTMDSTLETAVSLGKLR